MKTKYIITIALLCLLLAGSTGAGKLNVEYNLRSEGDAETLCAGSVLKCGVW